MAADTAQPNAATIFCGQSGGPFEISIRRAQPVGIGAGRGQFMTLDSLGRATLNGGAYVLGAGVAYPAFNTATDGSPADIWTGTVTNMVQSTAAGASFTDADMMAPVWFVDAQTPSKIPIVGGVDLPIGGFAMGMAPGSTTQPRMVVGPLAAVIGLGIHAIANETAGSLVYAVDGSASTDLASSANPFILPRKPYRGVLTGMGIVPSAALAATSGSDAIITFVKVDSTGVVPLASSPTVATFTTTTTLVAGVRASFVLGTLAARKFRTTDLLGYYRTHNSAGAVIPQSAIVSNFQVI